MVEVAFQNSNLDLPTIITLFLFMLIFLIGLFFRFWFFPNKKDLEKIDIHLKYLGKRMDSIHDLLVTFSPIASKGP